MIFAQQTDEFESLRPHLLSVAYRLTGTFADAEDAVQDAWMRWHALGSDRDGISDLRAWLTTVVSRIGLDRLRSAAHRREAYFGEWLPEPVVTTAGTVDPLAVVVANEDARFAAMVVLERLTPDQRVAFVLHDGFAVPFDEIAEVLAVSAASARQLASRARRMVADADVPARDASHDEVVGKLMAAMASGDLAAVVALLHPDVTFTGDSNRMAPTAARVIHGADKVARFVLGTGCAVWTQAVRGRSTGTRQRRARALQRARGHGRRVGRAAAAHPGADGSRRVGVRHLGCRQPGEVHGFSTSGSLNRR